MERLTRLDEFGSALLALDPVQEAWQVPAAPAGLPVATLVQQVHSAMPGVEDDGAHGTGIGNLLRTHDRLDDFYHVHGRD